MYINQISNEMEHEIRYTTSEVAEIIGRSVRTVRIMINKGKLKAYKIGSYVVLKSDLDDYLKSVATDNNKE